MEQMKASAPAHVDGLRSILGKYGVPKHARILDLASGIGRISIGLARAGYVVVGVDISPLYLGLAKMWAEKERVGSNAQFYRMDTRRVAQLLGKKGARFDAIISIGTSLGYHGEAEDERTFRGLREVASPRALLIIETVNRDYLVRHFREHDVSERDGVVWHDNRKLDLESSFMNNNWKFYRKTKRPLRLVSEIQVSHRVYSLHELKTLVDSSGWDYVDSYGSLRELTPLTMESFHMTLVARRRAPTSKI